MHKIYSKLIGFRFFRFNFIDNNTLPSSSGKGFGDGLEYGNGYGGGCCVLEIRSSGDGFFDEYGNGEGSGSGSSGDYLHRVISLEEK